MKMKVIVISIFMFSCITTFAESIHEQHFESKEICEQMCLAVFDRIQTESLSSIFAEFYSGQEALDKIAPAATAADTYISKAGPFIGVQKVGERQLGDYYYKQGYLVKYDEAAMFFEIVIVRTSKGYEAKLSDFKVKGKQSSLLKEIPEYCWE